MIAVALLLTANLATVKAFGEFEFWFALIKVITILLMIVAGLGLIFFGIGNGGHPIGISNLWSHGGFLPHGWMGFFFALSIVIGSYQGVELIGITAGETKIQRKILRVRLMVLFGVFLSSILVQCLSLCQSILGINWAILVVHL